MFCNKDTTGDNVKFGRCATKDSGKKNNTLLTLVSEVLFERIQILDVYKRAHHVLNLSFESNW